MCHLSERISMDVKARRCFLLKELIIPRQGLGFFFACRIPLAQQILLAIQEILQTQSFLEGYSCHSPVYQHHRDHRESSFLPFSLPFLSMGIRMSVGIRELSLPALGICSNLITTKKRNKKGQFGVDPVQKLPTIFYEVLDAKCFKGFWARLLFYCQ